MSPHVAHAVAPSPSRTWPSAARIAVVLVALLALANLLVQLSWGLDAPPKTDYLAFTTGAHVLRDQPSCLYCANVQANAQATVLGYVPSAGFPKPYVNPPLVALLLQPLSGLSLRTGLMVMMLVLLLALALAAWLFVRMLPRDWPGSLRLLLVSAAVVSLPAATALGLAQWAPLLLLAALGAVAALRRGRGRPVLAGLLLSVLLIKPQAVWLVLPALAVAGSWRVLAGFALGAAGWAATGLALVGPDQLLKWPRLIFEKHVDEAYRTAGLPGIVTAVTGSGRSAFVAGVVLGALVVAGMAVARRRLHGRADLAVGLGVAASLVCAPHVFPDDLMLLAVTAVVWAPLAPRAAVVGLLAVSVAYQVDGWLPGSLAHLTAIAALAVLAGAAGGAMVRGVVPRVRQAVAPASPGVPVAGQGVRVG
jgi:hypothetical protein